MERDDRPAAGADRPVPRRRPTSSPCVNAARERGLPLSIKGGGHNIAGLAVCDGGLMLDMSLMRGVWVDPGARVARAQAGCLLGDVDRETQLHGLAAVLGFVSATGFAGLTLGGGFGYLTRRFGWTSDNLASIDLVTADGTVLPRVGTGEHRSLLGPARRRRQLRRRHGLRVQASPVGPEIIGGAIAWRGEDAAARARDVPRARGRGAARADLRRRAAHGAAGALARQGGARQADRRAVRLPHGPLGGGRDACSRRSRRSARRSATSFSGGPTSRSRGCSTRRSRRAGATTGSRSTCGASGRSSSRGDRARDRASRRRTPPS